MTTTQHYSEFSPLATVPLDDLPHDRIADALMLLKSLRAGWGPRFFVHGAHSTRVLDDLVRAGLVKVIQVDLSTVEVVA